MTTDHTTLESLLASLAITYTATFVPQSASRNKGDTRPSLNWRVKLTRHHCPFESDYMQGIGHLPGPKAKFPDGRVDAYEEHRREDFAAETGRTHRGYRLRRIPPPALRDVLYSLLMDAEGTDATFEEWAQERGYDTDSRKAEAIYTACTATAKALRRLFTTAELDALKDAYEGY